MDCWDCFQTKLCMKNVLFQNKESTGARDIEIGRELGVGLVIDEKEN